MGCCCAKPPGNRPLRADAALGAPKVVEQPQQPRRKFNVEDLLISKKKGEAFVKEEGSIEGNQFNIEECDDCDIFLLDYTATVYVDECVNCRIFVGPTESSVFVRNCKGCDLMIACQQFRSRDCADCKFGLFSSTEPIIETSSNMQFGCFDFNYFSLRKQMAQARLKMWNNKWWQIYDFNKNEDRSNWSLLPQEEVPKLLRLEACAGVVSAEEAQMDRAVPITLGSRPWPSQESCFAVFLPDSGPYIEEFLMTAGDTEGMSLARTRSAPITEERAKTLFAWSQDKSKLVVQCKSKEVTGIEVCGPGAYRQAQELLGRASSAAAARSVRVVPEEETQALAKAFFETWKDEI